MKLPKKIGVFLGSIFLIFLFLVIFGNYHNPPLKNIISKSGSSSNLPTGNKKSVGFTPTLISQSPETKKNVSGDDSTDEISKTIADSLIKLNPNGPTDYIANDKQQMLKALNPQKIADNIIKAELAKIQNINLGLEKISIKKVKVIPSTTTKAREKYFQSFQNILNKNFSKKTNNFSVLIAAYQKAIDEFYQLEVPVNLIKLHKREILLLSQQALLLTKLNNAEARPLEALAALRQNEQLNAQFNMLKKDILAANSK